MTEDIQQQILDELRTMTANSKRQYKLNKIGIVCSLVFLAIFLVLIPVSSRWAHSTSVFSQPVDSWSAAKNLIQQGENSRAETMLQALIKRYPDDDYGYALLGYLYRKLGNVKDAEVNYAKAYDLFPIEENKKPLDAIRMVLERKNTTPNQSSPP
jgi:cytochrome c-type biogenesis protein CcmH/NrfG